MKTKFFIVTFLSILLSMALFSQQNSFADNYTDSTGKRQGRWTYLIPFDSLDLKDQPNDTIVICYYRNDTLNGLYQVFLGEKTLRFETNYVDGYRQGWARLYVNNRLSELWVYQKGNIVYKNQLYRSGKIYREEYCSIDNQEQWYLSYYSNGNLKTKEYLNKTSNQSCREFYYKNGRIENRTLILDDKVVSTKKYSKRVMFKRPPAG